MNRFATIVELCERHGFVSKTFYPKLRQDVFNVEPTGALLLENLRSEWFNNVVVNKDISVFMNSNELSSTVDYARAACGGEAPFGVAEIDDKPKISIDKRIEMSKDDKRPVNFGDFFEKGDLLKFWMFVVPSEASKFFHQWQGQRRMWWRKFSASPGRYNLTDIKSSENENQSVEITAKYPWGTQVVESLALNTSCKHVNAAQLQLDIVYDSFDEQTHSENSGSPGGKFTFSNSQFGQSVLDTTADTRLEQSISVQLRISQAAAVSRLRAVKAASIGKFISVTHPYSRLLKNSLKTEFAEVNMSYNLVKGGRKQVTAQCITSEVCLSTMFLNTLCDAYDDPLFLDAPRPLLRLHRKLAPYKISVAISSSQKPVVDELKDLALYICRQLRSNSVSSLFLPISYKHTLDAQWKQYDQMGIPYNVLLNENTLKNGLVNLRSRDTTLKEQVDVMKLVPYVEQLIKNY